MRLSFPAIISKPSWPQKLSTLRENLKGQLTRSHNKIFIIPSRYGLYFITIVFVLFLISLSYGHSLAFTTTFIFVSLVMTSAHFTNYNLAGVEVVAFHLPEELYAGEKNTARVTLRNTSRKTRFDIVVSLAQKGESRTVTLKSLETTTISLYLKPLKRGEIYIKRLRVSTTFPFGLFYAWKFWRIDREVLVYPERSQEKIRLPLPQSSGQNKGRLATKKDIGADEFLGHQGFEDGMPYRGIDWKAYARGKGLLYKTFVEEAEAHFLLRPQRDLNQLDYGDFELERELSLLCSLIDQAHDRGLTYAVILDGERAHFGRGQSFKRESLKRLSSYKTRRQIFT